MILIIYFSFKQGLSKEDFYHYRRSHPGPRSDTAYLMWKRNGGRDAEWFVWRGGKRGNRGSNRGGNRGSCRGGNRGGGAGKSRVNKVTVIQKVGKGGVGIGHL